MAGFFAGIGRFFGIILVLLGIAVFAIRLQHAGPYPMPEGGNLLGAILAFVLAAWFFRPFLRTGALSHILGWPAVLATPLVMFFTLFSTLGEMEEVIALSVMDPDGNPVTLRLWVVDRDGSAWTTMSDEKAITNGLDGSTGELLRNGETSCVVISRHDDQASVSTTHNQKYEKYAVHRLAVAIGVFPLEARDTSTAIRMDPCP